MKRQLGNYYQTLKKCRGFSTTSSLETSVREVDIFNPSPQHLSLRNIVRDFVESEVDPHANEYNRLEKFNVDLFRKVGSMGLLGITIDAEYGGSGMDATGAVIAAGILCI
jgi:alkylation response protein AidB-like acyl-CoA dehydrogenase